MSLQNSAIFVGASDLPPLTAGLLSQILQQHLDFASQQLFDCRGVGEGSDRQTRGSCLAPALLHQLVPHLRLQKTTNKQTNKILFSVRTTTNRCQSLSKGLCRV